MAYWIFKCNPEKYRLADRLADPNNTLTWTVSQHRDAIGPGDTAFIWETGQNRGIRAVMRVDEAPREMAELETEQVYWNERDTTEHWRIVGTLTHRDVGLIHTDLRQVPGLEKLSVFSGFQQKTVFPVRPEEGVILLRLVAG